MADPDSFVVLYEREAEPVLVFLARRTLDVEVALDLAAETFAQAWQGWAKVRLDSPEEVRGWLFTIARRQLGRYLRRGRVERRALERAGLDVPVLRDDDLLEIERLADLAALRTRLNAGLHELSGAQRDAVRLRIVDEVPYPDLARRLGVSEPTARARVSRGLRALAAALEPAPATPGGPA
ncbi:MAG TPA: sigma-70 family RNA polymerase sigma factor [Solirubrobacteraceae bacterium]|nr:sigma-70 family RNA polymerase sigma factor [Solirubrobacteraceae bacterium]